MENKWNDKVILAAVKQRIVDKLTVVGQFVKDSAVLLVPVDTGNLKGSIHFQVNESELYVRIGTPVEYAPYVEFGTGENAENGQGRKGGWFFVSDRPQLAGWLKPLGQTKDGKYLYFTYGSKPHPFLRPALLDNKATIKKMLDL